MGQRKLPRRIQRNIEASVGKSLMKMRQKHVLRVSKLIKSNIFLPKARITIHYYERQAVKDDEDNNEQQQEQRSLLMLHGITDSADAMIEILNSLKVPPYVRVVIIDIVGHGEDLQRARDLYSQNKSFPFPTANELTNIVLEFVQVMKLGGNDSGGSGSCDVLGYSLGGALAYWLRQCDKQNIIGKSVLISPALQPCVSETFMNEIESGIPSPHFDWKRRKDLKDTFDKLKPYYDDDVDNVQETKQKQTTTTMKGGGIPDFLLEPILRYHLERVPPTGHYKQLIEKLRKDNPPEYYSTVDVDTKNSPRLVMWPENDYICNYEKGKKFFQVQESSCSNNGNNHNNNNNNNNSNDNTIFISVPNCGHVFDKNGKFLLDCMDLKTTITNYLYYDNDNNDYDDNKKSTNTNNNNNNNNNTTS